MLQLFELSELFRELLDALAVLHVQDLELSKL